MFGRMTTYAAFSALAAGVFMQPAFADEVGVTDDEITIGMFAPLSGALSIYGVDTLNAARMWYEKVNAEGGIHGRKVRVITEDSKCSAQDVIAVVTKFVTVDEVFMLHGGSCSTPTVAAQEYVTREKVPMSMLNAAGDAALFPPTRYVFGAYAGTQRAYGAIVTEFATQQLDAQRIALIVHDDEFGQSFRETAEAAAKAAGAEIVAVESISAQITDVTAPILNVRASNPDVVVSGGYPAPAVLIAQKAHEYGVAVPIIQANQGLPDPAAFAENVGNNDALANFYYNIPLNDLPGQGKQEKWLEMYQEAYPDRQDPSAYMAYGLPSAMAVVRALEAAGPDLTREKFIDAMEQLDFDTGVVAGPVAFGPDRRDGMRSSSFVKFDGETYTVQPGIYSWDGSMLD